MTSNSKCFSMAQPCLSQRANSSRPRHNGVVTAEGCPWYHRVCALPNAFDESARPHRVGVSALSALRSWIRSRGGRHSIYRRPCAPAPLRAAFARLTASTRQSCPVIGRAGGGPAGHVAVPRRGRTWCSRASRRRRVARCRLRRRRSREQQKLALAIDAITHQGAGRTASRIVPQRCGRAKVN